MPICTRCGSFLSWPIFGVVVAHVCDWSAGWRPGATQATWGQAAPPGFNSPAKRRSGGFINFGENTHPPIARVVFHLFETSRLADFFDHDRNPLVAETHVLRLVGDVIAPRHRTHPIAVRCG